MLGLGIIFIQVYDISKILLFPKLVRNPNSKVYNLDFWNNKILVEIKIFKLSKFYLLLENLV
jgi:hypothetical protein